MLQTLAQLLGFEWIFQAYTAEKLGRKVRNTDEVHVFAQGERIANLDGAVVVQADDVTGVGIFQPLAVAGEKGQRIGNLDVFFDAYMAHLHALFVLAGAHAHKGNAVTVARVHIGLYFEHKAREIVFRGQHFAFLGHA